jgi:hypothetical protein
VLHHAKTRDLHPKIIAEYFLIAILGALIFITVIATPIFAQTIPEEAAVQNPSQAEADYRYQFDLYRGAYNDYLITKSEYLKTNSLKASQEALTAAKKLAILRSEVLRTYNRWLMLQLLEKKTYYPEVEKSITALNTQFEWYLTHKAKINAAASLPAFESVMAEYVKSQPERNKLYATAQIDLKLAQIAQNQVQAKMLYDPLLVKLEPQKTIPEIEQGLSRVTATGEQINALILETKTKAGTIESEDMDVNQALRQASTRLENLRSLQLSLISTMMELETRYVR